MNSPRTATHVFYSRSENCIIDTCTDDETPRGHYGGHTLEETRKEYPDAIYINWEEAEKMKDEANREPVTEITEARYWEMLEVLPPAGWKILDNEESFKMSERYSGQITSIFARIGDRYFTLMDNITMKHEEIIKKCKEFINANA